MESKSSSPPDIGTKKFEGLSLSGGGIKGISQLGALHWFWENGRISHSSVKSYSGSSIGSVLCFLIQIGYQPMEIFQEVYKMGSFFSHEDASSVWDIPKKWGIMSLNSVISKVTMLLMRKTTDEGSLVFGMDATMTLGQLYKCTGKSFYITGSNVDSMCIEYFNATTHPDMECITAIQISCSLPVIFHSIKNNGSFYSDGGILDNIPVTPIDDGNTKILGIIVSSKDFGQNEPLDTFQKYIQRLLLMSIRTITKLRLENISDNCTIIRIPVVGSSMVELSLSSSVKMEMFLTGYNRASERKHIEHLFVDGWIN